MKPVTALALLMAWGALGQGAWADTSERSARLSIGPSLGDRPRLGVNLGHRTAWGAEQLMANVLRNPGLEPLLDGALIVVGGVDATGVTDDNRWTARAPDFWVGARYEVLSGHAAGQRGRVLGNRQANPTSGDRLTFDPMPSGLRPGDAIAVRGWQDRSPAPLWWTEGSLRSVASPRPGSPGQRAVALQAIAGQPATLWHHLDSIGERAGVMLPVQGRWRLSLWVKAETEGARLDIRFGRNGQAPWLQRPLTPKPSWQLVECDFDGTESGQAGPLQLSLRVTQGQVFIDDVALGARAAEDSPGGFRPEVLANLRALRPGYLRDWQGQLADLPANRQASPFARHPIRYRPGAHEGQFAYSLPEFLALAAAVGARPWVILPATATPDEARDMGRQLADAWRLHGFDEIVVEHGNEHWNPTFRPAGLAQASVLAEVADRAFAALREGAGPHTPLHRVLGIRDGDIGAADRLARRSRHSEGVALAPYFHRRQDAGESTAQALRRALHEDMPGVRQALTELRPHGRSVDIYEVNLHTTGGSASASERQQVLESPEAGAALARRLLQAAELGVTRQAVYTLAGYDSFVGTDRRALAPLFGITRDLAGPGHWRSSGRALLALNAVMGGPAYRVACSGEMCHEITALAWGAGDRAALVSSAEHALSLTWPCRADLQVQLDQAAPRIAVCDQGLARLPLPPQSWMTITSAPARPATHRTP